MKKENLRLIGLVLAGIVLLIVVAQNLEQQSIKILFIELAMPLAVMLIGTALLGYLIGRLSTGVLRRRRKTGGDKGTG